MWHRWWDPSPRSLLMLVNLVSPVMIGALGLNSEGDRGGTLVPCTVVRTVLALNAVDLRVTAGEVHAMRRERCRQVDAHASAGRVFHTRPPLTVTKDNAAAILNDKPSSDRSSPSESGGRAECAALSLPARRP